MRLDDFTSRLSTEDLAVVHAVFGRNAPRCCAACHGPVGVAAQWMLAGSTLAAVCERCEANAQMTGTMGGCELVDVEGHDPTKLPS